jgi:hypothetical protein
LAADAASRARLAAITGGGTVAANAVSNATTAVLAGAPASSACAAVLLIHCTYWVTAATTDTDAGPSHCPLLRSASTDPWEDAAELNSLASPSHAAEAASIGPAPGPVYIAAELISGGRTAKSIFEPFAA